MGFVSITGHFERPKVRGIAKRAEAILKKLGKECKASDIKAKKFNSKDAELVLAVGGDGTLLRVVRELKREIPVLGIAAGEKCALMQAKQKQLPEKLKKIAEGKFKVEKRLRLEARADGKKIGLALNEAMLVNKKSGSIISYCLKVNGKRQYYCRADACIVSTATGSTGHAFSAGGKRMKAGSSSIAIVPSNALNRAEKAVYRAGSSIIVLDGFCAKQEHEAVLDGQPRFPVKKRLLARRGRDALFLKV
ncbi:MAG: NAD(+)/NADH kinase [Candidatus Diapherotrites archaeon]|uniref:NAD(+)/NADH kinase n=1 Tax=Candidatus Iainarchaeum sp. TaxID=3101447 RepID=A0A939C8E3_9ARCH|nr:NAD(+)/NADH kinase [Candidatus Diapherotrites archaeon]